MLQNYLSDKHRAEHAAAWKNLEQAIAYEERGNKGFADRVLNLACRRELAALGFVPLMPR